MAAFHGILKTTGVALVAATVKTLWQLIPPTNHRLRLKELAISFRGVSNTDTPVLVELLYQTTAGTSSSLTPVKEDDSLAETLLATALQTFTVEPAAGNVIRAWSVHPQSGMVYQLPIGDEIVIGSGKRLALRCTAAQAQTADATARYEE